MKTYTLDEVQDKLIGKIGTPERDAFECILQMGLIEKAKKNQKEKDFDSVKTFRVIKEKISNDIADMNFEEIKAYLQTKKVRLQDWSV